jgi:hypothetical protein
MGSAAQDMKLLRKLLSTTAFAVLVTLVVAPPLGAGVMIRVRVPKEVDLRAAEQRLEQLSLRLLAASSSRPELEANARRFLEAATKVQSDMPLRLTLLRGAARQFVLAGKWNEALKTADRTCGEFNLSHAATRGELAILMASQQPPMAFERLCALCIDALEGLLAEHNVELASKVLWTLQTAERTNLPDGLSHPQQRSRAYSDALERYVKGREKVAAAFDKLAVNPFDVVANEAVGRYYYEECNDWESALPHLALGSDVDGRVLALHDLARPESVDAQRELASNYRKFNARRNVPRWLQERGRYWGSIADRPTFKSDHTHSSQEGVLGSWLGAGHSAARGGVPDGCVARLSLDHSTTNERVSWNTPWGEAAGTRAVVKDASPRENHWEGIFLGRPDKRAVYMDGWRLGGAPLVCPERLIGDLPGFTWSGWVKFNDARLADNVAIVMADSPDAYGQDAAVSLRLEKYQLALVVNAPGHVTRVEHDIVNEINDWTFVAATLTHDQRLRLTVNANTKEVRLGATGPRPPGKWTLVGGFPGEIDEVAFYPRPLTRGETTALFHWGLGHSGVGGRNHVEQATMSPVVYKPTVATAEIPKTAGTVDSPSPQPQPQPIRRRLPRPTDDEVAAGTKIVQEVYGAAVAAATTAETRQAVVRKLQAAGANDSELPGVRYVCLRGAATILSRAEVLSAVDAWEQVANTFDVSVSSEQTQLLAALQAKARSPAQHKQLCERGMKLFAIAVALDDFETAKNVGALCQASAEAATSESLKRAVTADLLRAKVLQSAHETAAAARTKYEADPTDVAAASAWGEFLCLYKGDWKAGLPLLAADKSKPLAALAERDQSPAARNDPMSIGDAWWLAAESAADDVSQQKLRSRSLHWYRQSTYKLVGLDAERVKKRVEELQKELSPFSVGETIDLLSLLDDARNSSGGVSLAKGTWDMKTGGEVLPLLAVHGSYEYTVNIRWEGPDSNEGPELRLPVGENEAHVYLGKPRGRLQLLRKAVLIGDKAVEFKNGQSYTIVVQIAADDANGSVRVNVNKHPELSWKGALSELHPGKRFSRIRFHSQLPYVVTAMQMKLTNGWVELLDEP